MNKCVALLWYGDIPDDESIVGGRNRLRPLYDELVERGVEVVSVPYAHNRHDTVAEQLQGIDGVMVWMNPIEDGQSRERLDNLLSDLVEQGVAVSARPDVIQAMGTKTVIYHTRGMGWGTDTYLYDSYADFVDTFPSRLSQSHSRVLKQERGSSGDGVWKVEWVSDDTVRVMNAGDDSLSKLSLDAFIEQWEDHFSGGAYLVDMPFLPRVAEGMIRCYMNSNRLIGMLHQLPKSGGLNVSQSGLFVTDGLSDDNKVYEASSLRYARLKTQLETEWIDEMCQILGLDVASLPVLWDIDFIMGDKTANGEDTYLLCEINVSSVSPPTNAPFDQLADTFINLLS